MADRATRGSDLALLRGLHAKACAEGMTNVRVGDDEVIATDASGRTSFGYQFPSTDVEMALVVEAVNALPLLLDAADQRDALAQSLDTERKVHASTQLARDRLSERVAVLEEALRFVAYGLDGLPLTVACAEAMRLRARRALEGKDGR